MKRIKLIAVVAFIVGMLTNCNDSFLERYPLDELTSETFWKNKEDLAAYTVTLYTYIPNHEEILWDDEVSDNMAPYKFNSTAAGLHLESTGSWDWEFLRKCNLFLENYKEADTSEDIKNDYAAEVRFFRAWYYYNRVMSYGDVPYVDKVLTTNDDDILYGKSTPRNEVMDHVIDDLIYASENLFEKRESGRINKYAALHLLSRIALSEGTYRKYHKLGESAPYFEKAVTAAESIMNSGKYEIYSTGDPLKDYEALYTQNDLEGNKEMIFFRIYDKIKLGHSSYPIRYIEGDNNGLTKDLIEDYLCIDGKPIALSDKYKGDLSLMDEVANRDPRLLQTIVPPGVGFFKASNLHKEIVPRLSAAKGAAGSMTSTGYHWRKAYTDAAVAAYDKAEEDLPIFRYAETLLNYAEAKAELETCTQTDIDKSINLIRDRVQMPHMIISELQRDPDSDMLLSAGFLDEEVSVLIEEVRRERRVELAAEGFRRKDLLRWRAGKFYEKPVLGAKWSYFLSLKDSEGKALYDNAMVGKDIWLNENGYIEPYQETLRGVGGRHFDSNKHYLNAIPLNEIYLNPNLEQNPGWRK